MTYKNAPIQEALFDIQIDSLGRSGLSHLTSLHEKVKREFPKVKKKIGFRGQFSIEADSVISHEGSAQPTGVIFLSEDERRQVQLRLDGFTFNILKPYNSWDEHFDKALELWDLYCKAVQPNNIIRIATRFVNKIEVPIVVGKELKFDEYFTIIPTIPNGLPDVFLNYFMQLHFSVDVNTVIILTQTTEPFADGHQPFILDIDTIQKVDSKIDRGNLKSRFEALREHKNNFFEKAITDKTRQLFS